jgi:hypothetical protein
MSARALIGNGPLLEALGRSLWTKGLRVAVSVILLTQTVKAIKGWASDSTSVWEHKQSTAVIQLMDVVLYGENGRSAASRGQL